ncbi:MAG: SRPBCC family protein [Gemmataceae bacterium]
MLKKILLVLVVLILVFVVIVALQPADFRVIRSTTINAPREIVFKQVSDFRNWEAWSPWAKLDPNVRNTFEGTFEEKGSKFLWVGNDKVGEGKMEILETKPPEYLKLSLEFVKPMASTAITEYKFEPKGEGTEITWTMSGTNGFVGKAFCMFVNMDKMVGGDFEKGLADIKKISEAAAKK